MDYNSGTICGKNSTDMCVLVNAGTSDSEVNIRLAGLNQIGSNFRFDPITFAYVREDQDPMIHKLTFDGN